MKKTGALIVCLMVVAVGFGLVQGSDSDDGQTAELEQALRAKLLGWGLTPGFADRFLASAPLRDGGFASTRDLLRRLHVAPLEQQRFFNDLGAYRTRLRPVVSALADPGGDGSATGGVPAEPLADAFLSDDPFLDCSPFLTSVEIYPGGADPRQISVRSSYAASSFPTDGEDFVLLSTGDPDLPGETSDVDFGDPGCVDDNVQLVLTFDFPDLGEGVSPVNSMKFDFDFFSYEFPEFVGLGYNDYVFAYVDAPVPVPLIDSDCNAPLGFDEGGCLVTFDGEGDPTNVDSVFFQSCSLVGCDADGVPGWESEYQEVPGDDSGRTGTLITCTPTGCTIPVTPGTHTLTLMVGDAGDGIYTSAGLFDNLRCYADLECEVPTTEPVYLPPLCERILGEGSTPEVAEGRASVQQNGAWLVSLEPVLLQNAEFDSDFGEGEGGPGPTSADFTVSVVDPMADGQGIVVATDSNGLSCSLEVDFNALPAGELTGEPICDSDGVIVLISNPETPGGVASCVGTEQGEGEPDLPLGWFGSPDGDMAPCLVYTVDSQVIDETEIVLKKDGDCDSSLRLLFSRSSDGGQTFPPFVDVTEDLQCITDIIPDPTRLAGKTLWSPVKITCGILVLDCSDPAFEGLDQDGDGVPFCENGAVVDCNDANPAIPVLDEAWLPCNGLDDDCDGEVDEQCVPPDDDDEDADDEDADDEDADGGGEDDEGHD